MSFKDASSAYRYVPMRGHLSECTYAAVQVRLTSQKLCPEKKLNYLRTRANARKHTRVLRVLRRIDAIAAKDKYKQHLQLRPRVRGRQVHALGIRVVRVLRIKLAHELRHQIVGELLALVLDALLGQVSFRI